MLMELLFWRKYAGTRKTSVLLFVDDSMQIFLRYISLRIWEDVCHTPLKKIIKMSKWWVSVSAQNLLTLWTLNPGATSSCSAVWIHAIRVCFRKQHSVVYLLIHFTISIITVTSNHHPFLFSSETWESALSSLSLSVFRACNDVCVSLSRSRSLFFYKSCLGFRWLYMWRIMHCNFF